MVSVILIQERITLNLCLLMKIVQKFIVIGKVE
nr:MAG TPA: hypothetical protein [Crassvirales sp.]